MIAIMVIIGLALIAGLGFGFVYSIVYGICWCFGGIFSWKIALGIYLILLLLMKVSIKIDYKQ